LEVLVEEIACRERPAFIPGSPSVMGGKPSIEGTRISVVPQTSAS
jgi:uncharacterized protein (DUF433 family)